MIPERIVNITDIQKEIKTGVCQIGDKGAMRRDMAIIWLTVFSLPQIFAPLIVVWLTRQPAIANSRARIINTAQAGIFPNSTNTNNGASTNNLSTKGSRNLPNSLIWFNFLNRLMRRKISWIIYSKVAINSAVLLHQFRIL